MIAVTNTAQFTPLFVGGAPRTGTTVLHGLLCTAEKTNPYISECSYFSAYIVPFEVGLNNFDTHTRHYFSSVEEFTEYHGAVCWQQLTRIWERVGKPEVLVLKDPTLTPGFPYLARLLKTARFVVSVRDPRDTMLSRIDVLRRANKDFTLSHDGLATLCAEYTKFYGAILDNLSLFGERLSLVQYHDVVSGRAIPELENLGIGKIHPDAIWKKSIIDVNEYAGDPWATSLHGQKISTASVGRYKNILSRKTESFILDQCGDMARAMGLPMHVTRFFPLSYTLARIKRAVWLLKRLRLGESMPLLEKKA